VLDFLEAIVKETSSLLSRHQSTLKKVMEAAKLSEIAVDKLMESSFLEISDPEFLVYLDSEIENQDSNSAMENFLVTIKLRMLDEIGRSKGVDVTMLPKLAADHDPNTMRINTYKHLEGFDSEGKLLFLQTLKLIQKEMKKRYTSVRLLSIMHELLVSFILFLHFHRWMRC
jgi:hypothetical protein